MLKSDGLGLHLAIFSEPVVLGYYFSLSLLFTSAYAIVGFDCFIPDIITIFYKIMGTFYIQFYQTRP